MQSLAEYLYRAECRGDVRFLLIGGRALEAHGYVRNTKDVDLLIATEDKPALERLLQEIGYSKVAETAIFSRWQHKAMGTEDVDVMFVNAPTFTALAADTIEMSVGSATLRVPSVRNVIALKIHATKNDPDRLAKDTSDITMLMKLKPEAVTIEELKQLCAKYGNDSIWQTLQHFLA